jgi:hypothetical protein
MTPRHCFILASILVVTGACQVTPIAEPAEVEARPEAVEAATFAAESAAALQPSSTVCRAFHAQLVSVRTQLVEKPEVLELQAAAATLEGIITLACD